MLTPIDSLGVQDSNGWSVRCAGRFNVSYTEAGRTWLFSSEGSSTGMTIDLPAQLPDGGADDLSWTEDRRIEVARRLCRAFDYMNCPAEVILAPRSKDEQPLTIRDG
jgi:hypothetical protein